MDKFFQNFDFAKCEAKKQSLWRAVDSYVERVLEPRVIHQRHFWNNHEGHRNIEVFDNRRIPHKSKIREYPEPYFSCSVHDIHQPLKAL